MALGFGPGLVIEAALFLTEGRPQPVDRFDVVIAGAGLAGSSLALRLARAGVAVALLDPSRFPRDKICGEFLSPECWDAFDDLGLTDRSSASTTSRSTGSGSAPRAGAR